MWLPKDERRLLLYYYRGINKVNGEESLDLKELVQSLFCKNIKELQLHEKEKRDKDIAYIGTGDCLGEMALIGGQTRVADVVADTDCVLLKISSSLLDNTSDSVKHLFFKNFAITLVHRLSGSYPK